MRDCIEFILFILLVDFIWLKFFKPKPTYDRCDAFKVGAFIALICLFLRDVIVNRKIQKCGTKDLLFGVAAVILSKHIVK